MSLSSGIQSGGAADSDEWGARALESRPLRRCVQADSRVTRSVRGAQRVPPVVSAAGTHGSRRVGPRGWHRSESRAIAVRVRSGSSSGVPRIPSWLQKSSSSVWPREATPVAAGVGDGGLAQSGDRRRRNTLTGPVPETAIGPLGSRRAARWWKASRTVAAVALHGAAGKAVLARRLVAPSRTPAGDGGVRVTAGPLPWSAKRRPRPRFRLDEAGYAT